jgi:ABC-type branched-subunit amino acid transport system ATPase component
VAENLALGAGLGLPRRRLEERLGRVHDTFPQLAERAGQRAGTMSGGQQQMLAIGRALMADPKLLICDEISLGLAPLAVDAMYEALRKINGEGVAILLVEQNVQRCLELAQHAYVLMRGEISYAGDPQALLSSSRLDAAYFGTNESPTLRPQSA